MGPLRARKLKDTNGEQSSCSSIVLIISSYIVETFLHIKMRRYPRIPSEETLHFSFFFNLNFP